MPRRVDLPLDAVLDTGLFDEELGEVNPGWVQALNDEPTPETEEYGITSFVYRHRWPFHPAVRLAKALEGDWSGVLRSKGFFWLATRPDVQAMWSQAGLSVMLEPLAEWMAAVPESEWEFETPEDRIEFDERWDPIVGDRQTEIVFIGIDMDEDEIRHRLDDCVLTGREFEKGAKSDQKWMKLSCVYRIRWCQIAARKIALSTGVMARTTLLNHVVKDHLVVRVQAMWSLDLG